MDWTEIFFLYLVGLALACMALLIRLWFMARASRREKELWMIDAAIIQVQVRKKRIKYQGLADLPFKCKLVTGQCSTEITAQRKLEKLANRYGFTLNWIKGAA